MKKKSLITLAVILSLVVVALSAMLLCSACNDDKTSWNISSDGGEMKAYFSDNGKHGFILNIEGSGAMPDYSSEKDTPWYGKSGRVTEIKIADGITSIGKNAFAQCVYIDKVILPASVTAVGENAFSAKTECFAYSSVVTVAGDTVVYNYSETAPTTAGKYWHLKNDIITVWESNIVTTKVLFIGNSFTYYSDIPGLFGKIAASADKSVVVDSVTQGSWTLTKFADENDEYGKIVDEKLKANNDYDVVVLQDQSTRPVDSYSGFLSGAKALQTKINATQKNATIYLYSTWAWEEEAAARKTTVPELEKKICEAYDNAAAEMGVKVTHVGTAFTKVYTDYPNYKLYWWEDNKHPSYLGAYLSACVHVATILNCDPRTADYVGHNDTDLNTEDKDVKLDEATAKILRQIAYEVAFGK